MLRDVIGALNSILGGAPDEDRPRNLEIIQEEDSSDEAEGAVADPMEGLDLYQSTEVETISDTGNAGAVQPKVRVSFMFKTHINAYKITNTHVYDVYLFEIIHIYHVFYVFSETVLHPGLSGVCW
jgi:hypothetical protein